MQAFSTRVDRNRQAIDLMKRIAARPDDRQRYLDAFRFYTRHGMKTQAAAMAAAMRRHATGNRT